MNETKMIIMLKDEGFTLAEIAAIVGLHPQTVAKKILFATEPRAARKPVPSRVKRDRDNGMAFARIAAKYGITKKAVKEYLAAA